jgi:hypothetical protein
MKLLSNLLLGSLLIACSIKPVRVKEAAKELYRNNDRVCPDIENKISTRRDAAYCLGWMYINETDRKIPRVDQLAFNDVVPGDPVSPYVWIVVTTGIMSAESSYEFGIKNDVTEEEWDNSIDKLKKLVSKWEKMNPTLRSR